MPRRRGPHAYPLRADSGRSQPRRRRLAYRLRRAEAAERVMRLPPCAWRRRKVRWTTIWAPYHRSGLRQTTPFSHPRNVPTSPALSPDGVKQRRRKCGRFRPISASRRSPVAIRPPVPRLRVKKRRREVPGRAQWWDQRGRCAALILLFGLLAGGSSVSNPPSVRDAVARLTPFRSINAAAVPRAILRANPRESQPKLLADLYLPPAPKILRRVGLLHPAPQAKPTLSANTPGARSTCYRARAPPQA